MFPRITKSIKNGYTYEYLVISESGRIKGKGSTIKNIATPVQRKYFSMVGIKNPMSLEEFVW